MLKERFALGELTFQTVHNDYFDFDSPSITKAQYAGTAGDLFSRSGRSFAYLGYVPNLPPLASAPGVPFSNAGYNQYYKFAVNARKDHLYGLTLRLAPTPDARPPARRSGSGRCWPPSHVGCRVSPGRWLFLP